AALFGEGRDVEAHDRAVDVGRQADVALEDRLLDRAEDAAVPRLDDDLVRFRNADPGQLVERCLRPVVLDVEPFHERRGRAARADAVEVALHDLQGAGHLAFDARQDLAAHPRVPPTGAADEITVPTGSPRATRVMLSGWLRSKTMIGRSFSMQRLTAVAS